MINYPPIGTLVQIDWLDAASTDGALLTDSDYEDLKVLRVNWGQVFRIDEDGLTLATDSAIKPMPDHDCYRFFFIPHGIIRRVSELIPKEERAGA